MWTPWETLRSSLRNCAPRYKHTHTHTPALSRVHTDCPYHFGIARQGINIKIHTHTPALRSAHARMKQHFTYMLMLLRCYPPLDFAVFIHTACIHINITCILAALTSTHESYEYHFHTNMHSRTSLTSLNTSVAHMITGFGDYRTPQD